MSILDVPGALDPVKIKNAGRSYTVPAWVVARHRGCVCDTLSCRCERGFLITDASTQAEYAQKIPWNYVRPYATLDADGPDPEPLFEAMIAAVEGGAEELETFPDEATRAFAGKVLALVAALRARRNAP